MDDNQYKAIENEALQIVGTLNKLKEEIEGYKDAKVQTQKSLDLLDGLLGAVTDAAKQLSGAAKDLRKSDFITLSKTMSKEAEMLSSACETLQKGIEDVPAEVEALMQSHQERQEQAQSALTERVERCIEADTGARESTKQAVATACESVINGIEALPAVLIESIEAHDAKQAQEENEILERISQLEQIIGRIDRNTQKGFGKERG